MRPRAQQADLVPSQDELVERKGGHVTVKYARLRLGAAEEAPGAAVAPRRVEQQEEPPRLAWHIAELLLDARDSLQVVAVCVGLKHRLHVAERAARALSREECAAVKVQQHLLFDSRRQPTGLRLR